MWGVKGRLVRQANVYPPEKGDPNLTMMPDIGVPEDDAPEQRRARVTNLVSRLAATRSGNSTTEIYCRGLQIPARLEMQHRGNGRLACGMCRSLELACGCFGYLSLAGHTYPLEETKIATVFPGTPYGVYVGIYGTPFAIA